MIYIPVKIKQQTKKTKKKLFFFALSISAIDSDGLQNCPWLSHFFCACSLLKYAHKKKAGILVTEQLISVAILSLLQRRQNAQPPQQTKEQNTRRKRERKKRNMFNNSKEGLAEGITKKKRRRSKQREIMYIKKKGNHEEPSAFCLYTKLLAYIVRVRIVVALCFSWARRWWYRRS